MNRGQVAFEATNREGGRASFLAFLDGVRKEIDEWMGKHIALRAGGDRELADHFRGGKRLRGGTVLLLYEALSDGDGGRGMALDLAAAIELAHAVSLMIDDVLDGDRIRRDAPSLPATRGPHLTILEAVRMLSVPYSLAGPHGTAVISHLAATHELMVSGALAELQRSDQGKKVPYARLISMKSGSLFELAARFGALAAGCCEEKAALAGAYGNTLGTVHQFADDIVDLRDALSAGREVRGSEGLLFQWAVREPGERRRAIDHGALGREAESELDSELQVHVRRAERAALKLSSSVGRCGGRRSTGTFLPIMLSAPFEIASAMISSRPYGRK
ncbi:MAG: polyprenyl synthetase family protein [Methanomassiliicoccus sp.]|nr:polyprenyl synthetase family protein [Methanomassiliicoccus sp.]